MPELTFALDEDVAHPLASFLRSRGLNADSAKELGRLGLTDALVLLRAAEDRQILVTHTTGDTFRLLHNAWVTWRSRWELEIERLCNGPIALSQHAGILIVPQIPILDLAPVIEAFEASPRPTEDRLFDWNRAKGWFELIPGSPGRT